MPWPMVHAVHLTERMPDQRSLCPENLEEMAGETPLPPTP